MRILAALILTLALAPAANAASPFVLKARGSAEHLGVVKRIGDFKPWRDARLAAAIEAFGEPTRTRGTGSEACRVRWRPIGLTILFANFGGADACNPEDGLAQGAVVKRDRRWHTVRGLHIGARVRRLLALYPNAERRGGAYRLVEGFSQIGDPPTHYSVLAARVRDGRVRAFTLFIGAAGD